MAGVRGGVKVILSPFVEKATGVLEEPGECARLADRKEKNEPPRRLARGRRG